MSSRGFPTGLPSQSYQLIWSMASVQKGPKSYQARSLRCVLEGKLWFAAPLSSLSKTHYSKCSCISTISYEKWCLSNTQANSRAKWLNAMPPIDSSTTISTPKGQCRKHLGTPEIGRKYHPQHPGNTVLTLVRIFFWSYIYIYLYCSTMGNAPRLKDESFPICCLICTLVQYILLMGQVMRFNTHQDFEGVLGSAHHTCKSPVSQLVARSSPVLQRKVA